MSRNKIEKIWRKGKGMTKEQMVKILRKIHPDWSEKEIQKGAEAVYQRQNLRRTGKKSEGSNKNK